MVSKRLKRIRKRLREKNPRAAIPQIVTTPTNDMMNALADRSVYNTNYVSDRKPSRKKLRNMRSKMVNEAENPNASAAMMSRLAHLMSNGTQNDMLTQRLQAVQNNVDNKTLEITYKNQLAALQEREKYMVNEGKHEAMRKKYEDKIQEKEYRIKELEEEAQYRPQLEEARSRNRELELQLKHQEDAFKKEKQYRELAENMAKTRQQIEYNQREADYQRQIYTANTELESKRAEVDALKEANRKAGQDYELKQLTDAMNNTLLKEALTAQKNEITQMFTPVIEHLKNTNEQTQNDRELRQLISNQNHQIQELQNKIEYNTVKGAKEEEVGELREHLAGVKHAIKMKKLNRDYDKVKNRVPREMAELNAEEKKAEAMAEAEDLRNPETARSEVALSRARHTKDLSVNMINTHRETNKEIAVAIAHFDTLGMTEGLKQVAGLSGDDITKSLTSEQCMGYILREKVKREEDFRTLQEHNATLASIIEISDKTDAVYEGVEYKTGRISQKYQTFLDKIFGEEYRAKIRDDKYCKIYPDLLEKKRSVIDGEADDYALQERIQREKEFRGRYTYLGEENFQEMYKDTLDDVEITARAKKRAELEDALRDEAYAMADKEVKAMPVPLLPAYIPKLNTYVNQQYKLSQVWAKEVDGMMDKIAETEAHNANIVEYARELQEREINSSFSLI